jgi:hypothetical protein
MGAALPGQDASSVRDAIAALARAMKRVATHRHAPDQQKGYLEQALAELRTVLEVQPALAVTIAPAGLQYEGELVHEEPARENNFCFRLHRDGVRALTFRRGLDLDELRTFANVATADLRGSDHEDALTELWKAELPHIGHSAGPGYRMDEPFGEGVSATIAGIAARVQVTLDRHVGERFVEGGPQPLLWNEAQRAAADPQDWPRLASRAAQTVLRIVAEDYAGWDIEALEETFARLADQMLEQHAGAQLAQALNALKLLPGTHGADFRVWMGRWLSDPARLGFALEVQDAAQLLAPWLALLPHEAGVRLLGLLPRAGDEAARQVLARAILARADACGQQIAEVLRAGSATEARPLLTALSALAAARRAELAAAAFLNQDGLVVQESIPHLAADTATAARALGPALRHPLRAVRMAAAGALSTISSGAERASGAFIDAVSRPQFAEADAEEQVFFYRAFGKLGSTVGFMYLSSQLSLPPKKFFGRRRRVHAQLLAVEGLAEEGTPRSLHALDDGARAKPGTSKSVAAACKAAAQRVRAGKDA